MTQVKTLIRPWVDDEPHSAAAVLRRNGAPTRRRFMPPVDPQTGRFLPTPLAERMELMTLKGTDSQCWPWQGPIFEGYGRVGLGRTALAAHRVAYELAKGPIPAGLVIDHLCRNTKCVNPAHLEAVTNRENVVVRSPSAPTALNARKTHCHNGHEFTPDNTRITTAGTRQCRTCEASRRRARRQRPEVRAREYELRRRPEEIARAHQRYLARRASR